MYDNSPRAGAFLLQFLTICGGNGSRPPDTGRTLHSRTVLRGQLSIEITLWHVHYGRPVDRWAPVPGDEDKLAYLASILKQCPKAERISLECSWHPDFETAIRTAEPLMEVFRQ